MTGGVLMTRNLLTKLRATNSWPPNGTGPANGAAYPGVPAQKIFYNERSGVPAQPPPSPDRAASAQGAAPVPLTLASAPPAGEPPAGDFLTGGVPAAGFLTGGVLAGGVLADGPLAAEATGRVRRPA